MSDFELPNRFGLDDDEEDRRPASSAKRKGTMSVPSRKLSRTNERTNETKPAFTSSTVLSADEYAGRPVHPDLNRKPVNGQGAEYLKKAMGFYAKKLGVSLTEARDRAYKHFIPADIQDVFFQGDMRKSGYELEAGDYYPGLYDIEDDDELDIGDDA